MPPVLLRARACVWRFARVSHVRGRVLQVSSSGRVSVQHFSLVLRLRLRVSVSVLCGVQLWSFKFYLGTPLQCIQL